MPQPTHFHPFTQPVTHIALPDRFTFPFHYEAHPLCVVAAEAVQAYLAENGPVWGYHFGWNNDPDSVGKMFGVLVVKNKSGELGFLAAFSGKLGQKQAHEYFVPPVFDRLDEEGFFRIGEEEINLINRKVESLEQDMHFVELKIRLKNAEKQSEIEIENLKEALKNAKNEREIIRNTQQPLLSATEMEALHLRLNAESADWSYRLKDLRRKWQRDITALKTSIAAFQQQLEPLKQARKALSSELQQQLFANYTFLNQYGERSSLIDIFPFKDDQFPPSGAGECAAPKLLHYAFAHHLELVAMAEFWWGESPNSEIRKHKHYYPACKSKCEPILAHMLQGVVMDENPTLTNPAEGKTLDIIYEDEAIIVVNKPAEFLSVPGKNITDSVYQRIKNAAPDTDEIMIVHRLDMSTSGLIVLAKSMAHYHFLQAQFIKRKVKKRYVALLEGTLPTRDGTIDLPIRVDLENRPRQMVCYRHGKPAQTNWEIIETIGLGTKVYFYPITGRTHQLRVHAAHPLGLNTPIKGDDLYGTKADRLYLHAESLTFQHPVTQELVTFCAEAEF